MEDITFSLSMKLIPRDMFISIFKNYNFIEDQIDSSIDDFLNGLPGYYTQCNSQSGIDDFVAKRLNLQSAIFM